MNQVKTSSQKNAYFEVYVGTTVPMTFNSKITGGVIYSSISTSVFNTFIAVGATQTTPATTVQLSNYMPDIKVEDFFSGLLKMFNLTCYSENNGASYFLKQLEITFFSVSERTSLSVGGGPARLLGLVGCVLGVSGCPSLLSYRNRNQAAHHVTKQRDTQTPCMGATHIC
jgi:hypothetical protein